MEFFSVNDLNIMDIQKQNQITTLTENGNTIATQQNGIFPNTTKTIANQQVIADTVEGVHGETKILQHGHVTGFLKDGMFGETNLYDTHHHLIGTIDSAGNVKQVLGQGDPLSNATMVNFQELKFSHE